MRAYVREVADSMRSARAGHAGAQLLFSTFLSIAFEVVETENSYFLSLSVDEYSIFWFGCSNIVNHLLIIARGL